MAIGGRFSVEIGGKLVWATGDWEFNIGTPKREPKVASDGRLAGYSEEPTAPFCKGKVFYASDVSLAALTGATAETCQLDLSNGKRIIFRQATFTGDGTVGARSGEIDVQFHAASAEEVA